jgi:hypothetical protein
MEQEVKCLDRRIIKMPIDKEAVVPAAFLKLPFTGRLVPKAEVRTKANWLDLVSRDKEEARIALRARELKLQRAVADRATAKQAAESSSQELRAARARQAVRFDQMRRGERQNRMDFAAQTPRLPQSS